MRLHQRQLDLLTAVVRSANDERPTYGVSLPDDIGKNVLLLKKRWLCRSHMVSLLVDEARQWSYFVNAALATPPPALDDYEVVMRYVCSDEYLWGARLLAVSTAGTHPCLMCLRNARKRNTTTDPNNHWKKRGKQ